MLSELSTEEKKVKFLEYYSQLPNQKLGAGIVGVDEDTITNWKKSDKEFSDAVSSAKSEWALKKVGRVRSQEWLLERILKDEFAQRSEFTGKDGKDLPAPILGGISKDAIPTNNSNQEDPSTK